MNRLKKFKLWMCVCTTFIVTAGCAMSPAKVIYNTGNTIDTGMRVYGEVVKSGHVTLEQEIVVERAYRGTQVAMVTAKNALLLQKAGVTNTLDLAVETLKNSATNLLEAIKDLSH